MVETTFVDFLIQYGREGIFLILFGYLFWDTRQESKAREKELYAQLNKSNEQLDKSIEALEKIQANFERLDEKIDNLAKRLG